MTAINFASFDSIIASREMLVVASFLFLIDQSHNQSQDQMSFTHIITGRELG